MPKMDARNVFSEFCGNPLISGPGAVEFFYYPAGLYGMRYGRVVTRRVVDRVIRCNHKTDYADQREKTIGERASE